MLTVWILVGLVIITIALIVLHFSGSREILASKISGIWTNPDRSIRIVIYDVNSVFQAEIIWARQGLEKLMGRSIVKDLRLQSFNSGVGVYECPFTQRKLTLHLKMQKSGVMKLQFRNSQNSLSHTEQWSQVKDV